MPRLVDIDYDPFDKPVTVPVSYDPFDTPEEVLAREKEKHERLQKVVNERSERRLKDAETKRENAIRHMHSQHEIQLMQLRDKLEEERQVRLQEQKERLQEREEFLRKMQERPVERVETKGAPDADTILKLSETVERMAKERSTPRMIAFVRDGNGKLLGAKVLDAPAGAPPPPINVSRNEDGSISVDVSNDPTVS